MRLWLPAALDPSTDALDRQAEGASQLPCGGGAEPAQANQHLVKCTTRDPEDRDHGLHEFEQNFHIRNESCRYERIAGKMVLSAQFWWEHVFCHPGDFLFTSGRESLALRRSDTGNPTRSEWGFLLGGSDIAIRALTASDFHPTRPAAHYREINLSVISAPPRQRTSPRRVPLTTGARPTTPGAGVPRGVKGVKLPRGGLRG